MIIKTKLQQYYKFSNSKSIPIPNTKQSWFWPNFGRDHIIDGFPVCLSCQSIQNINMNACWDVMTQSHQLTHVVCCVICLHEGSCSCHLLGGWYIWSFCGGCHSIVGHDTTQILSAYKEYYIMISTTHTFNNLHDILCMMHSIGTFENTYYCVSVIQIIIYMWCSVFENDSS